MSTNFSEREREKKKRNRSTNFSEQETRLLTSLASKQLDIIESKQMDGMSWRAKGEAWDKLCEEFNLKSGTIMRTPIQLRSKYESMKGLLKRKIFKNRQEMCKNTGSPPHIVPLTDYEEKLFRLTISCDKLSGDTNQRLETSLEDSLGSSVDPLNVVDIVDMLKKSPQTEEDQPGTSQDIYENILDGVPSSWTSAKVSTYSLPAGEKVSSTQNRIKKKNCREKLYALVEARTELVDLQIQIAKSELKLKESQLENLENEKTRAAEKHGKEMELIERELRRKSEAQKQETERHLNQMELLEAERRLCIEKLNNKIS